MGFAKKLKITLECIRGPPRYAWKMAAGNSSWLSCPTGPRLKKDTSLSLLHSMNSEIHEHAIMMAASRYVFSDSLEPLNCILFGYTISRGSSRRSGRCDLVLPSLPLICRQVRGPAKHVAAVHGRHHHQSTSDPSARGYHDAWKGKGTG